MNLVPVSPITFPFNSHSGNYGLSMLINMTDTTNNNVCVSKIGNQWYSTNIVSHTGELLAIPTILSTILAGLLVDQLMLFLLGFCQSPLVLDGGGSIEFHHLSVEYMV